MERAPDPEPHQKDHNERIKRWAVPAVVVALCAVIGVGVYNSQRDFPEVKPPTQAQGLADPAKKQLAAHIISTFENSTVEIQYDYAENIDDGRGITAGRAGFTSGTGDLLEVVERYVAKQPQNNMLAPYVPALQNINQKPEGERDTQGLDGFIGAWKQAAQDPVQRQVQDEVTDEMYFNPAMQWAKDLGIKSALGQFILWDAIIQHGEGEDRDGLPALIKETSEKSPSAERNEAAWLSTFLKVREEHLRNAADPDTREAWRASIPRVYTLRSFLDDKNMTLSTPIHWESYGDKFHCNTEDACQDG